MRQKFKEDEIILDTSKVALSDLGSNGVKYPALWINLTLALELGWFVEDEDEADLQFAYKLGPNLCVQLHDHEIPSTTDVASFNATAGVAQHVVHTNKYWIRTRCIMEI